METVTIADGITERDPVDDQIVVEEDRHVLANGAELVDDVAPNRRKAFEVGIERGAHGRCVDLRCRALDMPTERFSELDPHHERENRSSV